MKWNTLDATAPHLVGVFFLVHNKIQKHVSVSLENKLDDYYPALLLVLSFLFLPLHFAAALLHWIG